MLFIESLNVRCLSLWVLVSSDFLNLIFLDMFATFRSNIIELKKIKISIYLRKAPDYRNMAIIKWHAS